MRSNILKLLAALLLVCLTLGEDRVVVVTPATFNELVWHSPEDVLLELYSPSCSHCQDFAASYEQLAEELKSNANFLVAKMDYSEERVPNLEITHYPTFYLIKKEASESVKIKFEGIRSLSNLKKFVLQHTSSGELPVDPTPESEDGVKIVTAQNFDEVVINSKEDVFLEFYAPWCGFCQQLAPNFVKLAQMVEHNPNILIAKIDGSEYKIPGHEITSFPTTYLFKKGGTGPSKILFEWMPSPEAMQHFLKVNSAQWTDKPVKNEKVQTAQPTQQTPPKVETVVEAETEKTQQSQQTVETVEIEEGVTVITSTNFEQTVLRGKEDVLLEFYAPWCGHCKQLAPTYSELAQKLNVNPNVIVAKVDATIHKLPGVSVKGYPTIIFFKKGQQEVQQIQYEQGRTVQAFLNFLEQNTSHPWNLEKESEVFEEEGVRVVTANNFQEVVWDSKEDIFLEFYAPWCGFCKSLVQNFIQVAKAVKHNPNIIVAKIDATVHKIPGIEVTSYPTTYFIKKGGAEPEKIKFEWMPSPEAMEEFIKVHSGYQIFDFKIHNSQWIAKPAAASQQNQQKKQDDL